ncbi:response regulator [uncultured Roseovarius sp.]|uniref:response regulator n=1 Tax=uncultured Roseovarius sp. TaxID=293344 RepID=UPI002616AACF|nr:response regulator [uncultured Roseovarius sp.]
MVDILLMDDDEDFTSVLDEALKNAGHKTTIARSASEALELIRLERFDLLIADLIVFKDKKSVPDGGISLISRLRGPTNRNLEPWARTMPIIAISGAIHNFGMTNILKVAQSLGADIALGKPTDTEDLLHAINTLTKHARKSPADQA